MKTALQSQFEHEHKAWERGLEFFRQENSLLKYRLSEMVDSNEETDFLQMAEYFQNELLLKDEMLNELIKDLQWFTANFDGLPKDKNQAEKIVLKHEKFRDQILQFEKNFLHLIKEFNEQMLERI